MKYIVKLQDFEQNIDIYLRHYLKKEMLLLSIYL